VKSVSDRCSSESVERGMGAGRREAGDLGFDMFSHGSGDSGYVVAGCEEWTEVGKNRRKGMEKWWKMPGPKWRDGIPQ